MLGLHHQAVSDFASRGRCAGNTGTKMLKKFLQNRSGATAIEYALIASLISMAIVVGVTAVGTNTMVTMATVTGNF